MSKKRRYTKSRKALSPIRAGEVATIERCRQLGGVMTEVAERGVAGRVLFLRQRARFESVLDHYLFRDRITKAEYVAGMKFREIYLSAVFHIKVKETVSSGGAKGNIEDGLLAVLEDEKTLRAAYAVLSSAQKKIIIRVCGDDDWGGTTDKIETLHRGFERLIVLWKIS